MNLKPNKSLKILLAVVIIFSIVRSFGIWLPYHQDEYKWALAVQEGSSLSGSITHPPLDELTFVFADRFFGNENLRILPFIFFIINTSFIFFLVKRMFNEKAALWASFLFSLSFYSVLASLMVDTDGQVLQFVSLLFIYFYMNWSESEDYKLKRKWLVFLFLTLCFGLLIKVSFGIVVLACIIEYSIVHRESITLKKILIYLGVFLGLVATVSVFIILTKLFFPKFDISYVLHNWERFFDKPSRNYFQTFIQFSKSIMYLSPIMILPLLFVNKDIFLRLRIYFLFIFSGLFFYLVLFDFSSGTLDRYLQFLIAPLAVICGVIVSKFNIGEFFKNNKKLTIGILFLIFGVFLVNFLNHFVPPLYPKIDWITRLISLKWNFLFPFTGGSGPVGFYVSFLFIALSFIFPVLYIIFSKIKNLPLILPMVVIVLMGISYNIVLAEEYLFGGINGSPNVILRNSLTYIKDNKNINQIINYNDTGSYELIKMNKKKQRLYVAPMFEEGNREILSNYRGYYFVLNFPKLNPESFQAKYFSSCKEIFKESSINVDSIIYDCKNSKGPI